MRNRARKIVRLRRGVVMTRVAVLYLVLVFVLVASTKAQAGAPAGIEIAELPLVAWGASRAHVLPDTLPDFATPG